MPKNLSSLTKSINNSLDEFNDEFENFQLDVKLYERFLQQIQDSKQKRIKFYQDIVSLIIKLQKIIKFATVSTTFGILSKVTIAKLNKLAKNCIIQVNQMLKTIKKIDSKLHLVIITKIIHNTNLI